MAKALRNEVHLAKPPSSQRPHGPKSPTQLDRVIHEPGRLMIVALVQISLTIFKYRPLSKFLHQLENRQGIAQSQDFLQTILP